MKHITTLAALVAALSLSACGDSPQEVAQKSAAPPLFQTIGTNPTDGCTVTKFVHYLGTGFYTICKGKPIQTTREFNESCGKNCTRHVVITTLNGTPDQPASETPAQ